MTVLKAIPRYGIAFAALLLALTAMGQAQTMEYDGLIEPYQVVEIGTPIEGIVSSVAVDRSSLVQAGQTLVELESSVERAAVDSS